MFPFESTAHYCLVLHWFEVKTFLLSLINEYYYYYYIYLFEQSKNQSYTLCASRTAAHVDDARKISL